MKREEEKLTGSSYFKTQKQYFEFPFIYVSYEKAKS